MFSILFVPACDRRRRISIARGLNRDKLIEIRRLSGSENFICERKELVVYTFNDF